MSIKLLLYVFLFWTNIIFSQTYFGKVVDNHTNLPLETVSVYFDGTTIGTITNSEGVFQIELPNNKTTKSLLVISLVGYESLFISNQDLKPEATYRLSEKKTLLDEVVLHDDWSRKKKMQLFKNQFLGFDKESLQCEILNEEQLKLVYNKKNNQLYASAEVPLVIKNKALGYVVHYNLVDFEITFTDCLDCFKGVSSVFYSGTTRFEELYPKKIKSKYIKARNKSYYGSLLHFMRSLASKELDNNGFKLFIKAPAKDSDLYFNTTVDNVFEVLKEKVQTKINLLQEDKVAIRYNVMEQSALLIKDDVKTFFIDDYGIHSPVNKIIFGGRFGNSRISTMLPNNYYPN